MGDDTYRVAWSGMSELGRVGVQSADRSGPKGSGVFLITPEVRVQYADF